MADRKQASWQMTRRVTVDVKPPSGETPKLLDDGSALFAAPSAGQRDAYTFTFDTDAEA